MHQITCSIAYTDMRFFMIFVDKMINGLNDLENNSIELADGRLLFQKISSQFD